MRNNVSHLPKEPKAFVIRKTRQIPFIDQLIAETLIFRAFTTESYLSQSNTWSSFFLLLRQKNQKHLSSAKLANYRKLTKKLQKQYVTNVVMPRTVADDVSAYQVTS